ncbi:hypothetical protein AWRI3579_g4074 [Hanseniaspora osmophila]|uniref:DUF2470 domain-containing protein n=1 Tax=Hanseniaspora osmophila TaxID=56408 RepID=A0A1E5R3I4_9ASCO|nr:hypothetical protein AWRI3579_g4074 [Hanseniaspora osmophila]
METHASVLQFFNKSQKHILEDFLYVYGGVDPRMEVTQIRLMEIILSQQIPQEFMNTDNTTFAENQEDEIHSDDHDSHYSHDSHDSHDSHKRKDPKYKTAERTLMKDTDTPSYIKISYLCDESSIGKSAFTTSNSNEDIITMIPLHENVFSYDDATRVLIDMALESSEKRGLSVHQINQMVYPSSLGEKLLFWLIQGPWIAAIVLWICSEFFQMVSSVWWKFFACVQLLTFFLHFIELYFIFKIHKEWVYYRVPMDYYIEWWIFTMLEGYPAIKRFRVLQK